MSFNYQIQPLEAHHAFHAHQLSQAVGWVDSANDWESIISISHGCALGVFQNDNLIGTAVGIPCGKAARISHVAVHPSFQGQRIGENVFGHLVNQLEGRQIRELELNATPAGRRLYEKYGFIFEREYLSFSKEIVPASLRHTTATHIDTCKREELDEIIQLDTYATGLDRSELIRNAFESPNKRFVVERQKGKITGFLIYSEENGYVGIGPWIHPTEKGAKNLLTLTLTVINKRAAPTSVFVDTAHSSAISILKRLGFSQDGSTYRMRRSVLASHDNPSIYYGNWTPAFG